MSFGGTGLQHFHVLFFIIILISQITSCIFFRSFVILGSEEPDWDSHQWKTVKLFPGKKDTSRGQAGTLDIFKQASAGFVTVALKYLKKKHSINGPKVMHGGRRGGSRDIQRQLSFVPGANGHIKFV